MTLRCEHPGAQGKSHWTHRHPERVPRGNNARWTRPKLSDHRVKAARETYATGGITLATLAIFYGVDQNTIWKAIHGLTWAHVPGAIPRRPR